MTAEHYLLTEFEELLRNDPDMRSFVLEVTLDGFWYWDLTGDQTHEYMSPKFWRVLGHDPATKEHLAAEWHGFMHPTDLAIAKVNAQRHIDDPSHPYDQIVRYVHGETGETVWIHCFGKAIRRDGEAVRMFGAHRNVTPLMGTIQRFGGLRGHAVLDSEGRYIHIDDVGATLNGTDLTPEDHIGRRPWEVVPAFGDDIRAMVNSVLHDGEVVSTVVQDADLRKWNVVYVPSRDPNGNIIGMVAEFWR